MTGGTFSTTYPTTPGAVDPVADGSREVYVSRLNSTGNALVYSTYLGASGGRRRRTSRWIRRSTPTSPEELPSRTFPSRSTRPRPEPGTRRSAGADGFVTKLESQRHRARLLHVSRRLEGDTRGGLALDSSGNVFVTGGTAPSTGFPTTPGAYADDGARRRLLTKFDAAGSGLVYSTYISAPGAADGVVDGAGSAYVAGSIGIGDPRRHPRCAGSHLQRPRRFPTEVQPVRQCAALRKLCRRQQSGLPARDRARGQDQVYVAGSTSPRTF